MNLPALTPLDTPIFDEDVIADMEKQFVDPCTACDNPAVWSATMRCCGDRALLCTKHKVRTDASIASLLWGVKCALCGHAFWFATGIDSVALVVPL